MICNGHAGLAIYYCHATMFASILVDDAFWFSS